MPLAAIPRIGLGTFKSRGDDVKRAVRTAIRLGLRHIDTATIYKNECEIGEAIREALAAGELPSRSDLFIVSKISPYEQGTEKATEACESLLARLDLEYVDLMLVHWPGVAKQDGKSPLNSQLRKETWRVMESFYQKGKFKALGVSNYEIQHLEELLSYTTVLPSCLQIECHPLFPQPELRAFCQIHGITVVAYSPYGGGELLKHPVVMKVACELKKTPAQTLLCWGLSKGCVVIPKSVQEERIAEFAPPEQPALRPQYQDTTTSTTENNDLDLHLDNTSRKNAEKKKVRYLPCDAEAVLDALGKEVTIKYCWDPSGIL